MTPEEVAKVRELLTHEDPDIQRQGLELAKSFGDYSAVFEGCSIDEEGKLHLSFGSLNNAMLEGVLESGVVDEDSISRMRTFATEGYSPWQVWIKRGEMDERVESEDYPAVWAEAVKLMQASKYEEACRLLEPHLNCHYIDDMFRDTHDIKNEAAVSRYLELMCGETLDEVLDHFSEIFGSGDCEIEVPVTVAKCGFSSYEHDPSHPGADGDGYVAKPNIDEGNPVISVRAYINTAFENRLFHLKMAVELNGGSMWLSTGVTFEWSSNLFDKFDGDVLLGHDYVTLILGEEEGMIPLWDETYSSVEYAFGAWNGQLPEWA